MLLTRLVRFFSIACLVYGISGYEGRAFQENASGPNKLIEASRYSTFATEIYECRSEGSGDPIHDAIKWTALAIKTAREFRTNDKTEQGVAAAFLARQARFSNDLITHLNRVDFGYKLAADDIKHFRLESAKARLAQLNSPRCDSRVETLKSRLDQLQANVTAIVARADEKSTTDPTGAMLLYTEAQHLNVEEKTIVTKLAIARAQQSRARKETSQKVHAEQSLLYAGLSGCTKGTVWVNERATGRAYGFAAAKVRVLNLHPFPVDISDEAGDVVRNLCSGGSVTLFRRYRIWAEPPTITYQYMATGRFSDGSVGRQQSQTIFLSAQQPTQQSLTWEIRLSK